MPTPISTIRNNRGPLVATPRDGSSVGSDYFRALFTTRDEFMGLYGPLGPGEGRISWNVEGLQFAAGTPTPEIVQNAGIRCRAGVWHISLIGMGEAIVDDPPSFDRYSEFWVYSMNDVGVGFTIDDIMGGVRAPWTQLETDPVCWVANAGMVAVPENGVITGAISNHSAVHDALFNYTISAHWINQSEDD